MHFRLNSLPVQLCILLKVEYCMLFLYARDTQEIKYVKYEMSDWFALPVLNMKDVGCLMFSWRYQRSQRFADLSYLHPFSWMDDTILVYQIHLEATNINKNKSTGKVVVWRQAVVVPKASRWVWFVCVRRPSSPLTWLTGSVVVFLSLSLSLWRHVCVRVLAAANPHWLSTGY